LRQSQASVCRCLLSGAPERSSEGSTNCVVRPEISRRHSAAPTLQWSVQSDQRSATARIGDDNSTEIRAPQWDANQCFEGAQQGRHGVDGSVSVKRRIAGSRHPPRYCEQRSDLHDADRHTGADDVADHPDLRHSSCVVSRSDIAQSRLIQPAYQRPAAHRTAVAIPGMMSHERT
jgi:hypothetical protein